MNSKFEFVDMGVVSTAHVSPNDMRELETEDILLVFNPQPTEVGVGCVLYIDDDLTYNTKKYTPEFNAIIKQFRDDDEHWLRFAPDYPAVSLPTFQWE